MGNVYLTASNYVHPYVQVNTIGVEQRRCRKIDLCRCIATVGTPTAMTWEAIRRFGFARTVYDSLIRKMAIVAVNIQTTAGELCRHPLFDTYTMDQKRETSYNLGMALAKFHAEQSLGVPNLVHVEFLKKQGAIQFAPTAQGDRGREPDLVGQSPDGAWHVFEAKGTSASGRLRGLVADAKIQASRVSAIDGAPPATRSACATYFGPTRLESRLEDPSSDVTHSFSLDADSFAHSYYASFTSVLELAPSVYDVNINGLDAILIDLPSEDRPVQFGLERSVLDSLASGHVPHVDGPTTGHRDDTDPNLSVGPDGFVVRYSGRKGFDKRIEQKARK